ncbi:MAG: hypothetical protein HQL99_12400 [Magnetococcales bacterium]|nr:hypothetical protein [Magnetococcales bacterium]
MAVLAGCAEFEKIAQPATAPRPASTRSAPLRSCIEQPNPASQRGSMFLLRLLLLMASAYLLYRLVRRFLPRSSSQELPRGGGASTPLVRCTQCATLIPPETAITRGEHSFCSENCRIASVR